MRCYPTWAFTSSAPARRRRGVAVIVAAAVLLFGLAACGSGDSRLSKLVSTQPAQGSRPLLVVQSPEGDSWLRLLRSGGLAAMEEPLGTFPAVALSWYPTT